MGSATRSGSPRWLGRSPAWPLWELPSWLVAFVLVVIGAAGAAIVAAAALTVVHGYDLELFAVLLGCDLVTVELTRRSGEPAGLIKETQAVWELPIALLLPPLYGLAAPIVRIALTQWRVRRALAYRRVFSAAALGLAYAAASVTFRALAPSLTGWFRAPASRVEAWAIVALACGVLRSALNKVLVMTAVKGSDPGVSIRAGLFNREAHVRRPGRAVGRRPGRLRGHGQRVHGPAGAAVRYPAPSLPAALPAGQRLPDRRPDRRAERGDLAAGGRGPGDQGHPAAGLAGAGGRPVDGGTGPATQDGDSTMMALLMVDLDHFDEVNNTCGHLAGNAVLAAVAATLREHLRETDLCGRYGGDEFAILLTGTSAAEAAAIADRLCLAVSELTFPGICGDAGPSPQVTVSVGIAALDGAHVDLDELVAAADDAMYQAKNAGRNTVRMVAVSR